MTSVLENYLAQLNNKETSHWYVLTDDDLGVDEKEDE